MAEPESAPDKREDVDTVKIDAERDTRRFMLRENNRDDWMVKVASQLIDACNLQTNVQLWLQEAMDLEKRVSEWCGTKPNVGDCFASYASQGITFFLVMDSATFDFALAGELASQTHQLPSVFNVGPIEMHQIPSDEADHFVNPQRDRRIYHR